MTGNIASSNDVAGSVEVTAEKTKMVVGYILLDAKSGSGVKSWGGVWGQCPGMPNPLILPNGNHVHAPQIGADYDGYTLVEWIMDEPPPPSPIVPESITRRQCALQLLSLGMISAEEALAMTKAGDVPTPIMFILEKELPPEQVVLAQIDFAAANYYRDNKLLPLMGMAKEEIDQFFIAAGVL